MPSGLICVLSIGVFVYACIMYFKHLPFVGSANTHTELPVNENSITAQP